MIRTFAIRALLFALPFAVYALYYMLSQGQSGQPSRDTPWTVLFVAGLVLVAAFLPEHIAIWPRLPVWYHLFFLITLAPFVALGAALRPPGGGKPATVQH